MNDEKDNNNLLQREMINSVQSMRGSFHHVHFSSCSLQMCARLQIIYTNCVHNVSALKMCTTHPSILCKQIQAFIWKHPLMQKLGLIPPGGGTDYKIVRKKTTYTTQA